MPLTLEQLLDALTAHGCQPKEGEYPMSGRPTTGFSKKILVYMSPQMHRTLALAAQIEGRTSTAVVRTALICYLGDDLTRDCVPELREFDTFCDDGERSC